MFYSSFSSPNRTSDKSPLPADSAYFTTSESKAKLLTRLRGSGNNLQDTITPVTDHQQLLKRKVRKQLGCSNERRSEHDLRLLAQTVAAFMAPCVLHSSRATYALAFSVLLPVLPLFILEMRHLHLYSR